MEKELEFEFEGRKIKASEGQSIAGALHASGVSVISRSSKYHRPRGYTCGFAACGNCPLTVDGMPSVISCTAPVKGGEKVQREQGFPTTGFDLIRSADLFKPLLPAGFQFRLFRKNPRLSSIAGDFMAVLAGGDRMPTTEAAQAAMTTEAIDHQPEVLVIGGGPSGLAAALGAADSGHSVIVADHDFAGGRSIVRTEQIQYKGQPVTNIRAHYARLLEAALQHERITLIKGSAVGMLDGVVLARAGSTRHEITPAKVVVATGSYEIPALFANNDRPGVMLADAAIKLAETEAVIPGRDIIVATDSDRGHDVAARLTAAGCHVSAVVDSRTTTERNPATGLILTGLIPARVHGWARVKAVSFSGASGTRKLKADTLVLAYGRRRSEEFALHAAYTEAGTHLEIKDDNPSLSASYLVVGSATGDAGYDTAEIQEQSRLHFAPPAMP
jgi:sarcosine oxidase subunit alpha